MEHVPARLDTTDVQRMFAARALLLLASFGGAITAELVRSGLDETVANNSAVMTLLFLDESGPARPVDLAGRAGMTTGGMTKVIDRLEAHDLVSRSAEGLSDGRGVLIGLTATGVEMVRRLCDATYPTLWKGLVDLTDLAQGIEQP